MVVVSWRVVVDLPHHPRQDADYCVVSVEGASNCPEESIHYSHCSADAVDAVVGIAAAAAVGLSTRTEAAAGDYCWSPFLNYYFVVLFRVQKSSSSIVLY